MPSTHRLPLAFGVLLYLTGGASATASPNLIANSSFEDATAGAVAESWALPSVPAGGVNAVTTAKARTGHFSHEITVPAGTEMNWYQANQTVPGLGPGKTVTLSVYIQAQDVRDGAGAYCSINCFDPGGTRVGVFDAEAKVQGTVTDWRRQTVTATLSPTTATVTVIFTLHGHGTACFDDVQLEEGTKATAWGPSEVDAEAARQLERERAEAAAGLPWFASPPAKPRGAVAVLRDSLPADGCASSPERLAEWLSEAGYAVAYLNATQLANRFILRGPHATDPGPNAATLPPFDLLILPYGAAFPAPAAKSLKTYLRQGGAFLSTGGYAFDNLLVPYEGKWFRAADLPAPKTPLVSVMSFDDKLSVLTTADVPTGWSVGSDQGGTAPVLSQAPGHAGTGRALQFAVSPMRNWSTASIDLAHRLPLPATTGGKVWSVTRFWAKGDAKTPKLAIEWHEADGSRWKANVPLSTQWKEYVLSVKDFAYWHDNPSVGRGGIGDHLHPERALRLLIGVASDIAERDQPHTFWLDDLAVQSDPLEALRASADCLNTRSAPIRDAMWPKPDQVPVFDPSHRLEFVTAARPSPGQFVLPADAALDGPCQGYSAVAMLSNQGHGFGPNLSRLVPLLDGLDRFGRYRGPVGSLLRNYAGYFRGSSFAFFGVTNRDLFGAANPRARALLLNTTEALLRRVYLHDTDTEFSSYRPGEKIKFRTQVSNFGREAAQAELKLEVFAGKSCPAESAPAYQETRNLALGPDATETVACEWQPPTDAPADFYAFRFTLSLAGKPVDREENGVVIWTERADRPTGAVGKRGAYFTFGDRPMFVTGAQEYWGQNGSVTARSPLGFERDFAMMQDYGLHFSRLFVPFKTDSDRRQSDAMVQLAQQHRIFFYHAPNLSNTASPEELSQEQETAKALGERYRGVPWLAVDICNEPSLPVDRPDLVGPFNDFLREKYATTEALRQAWGPTAPEIGKARPEPLSNRWDDVRSCDTHRFLAGVQKHWAEANRAAVQAADPARLVSVGHMQGFGDASVIWDPLIGDADLDFSDRHYYGPPSGQSAQLKDIDMRALGLPFIQGECGAKDHPTFASQDPWGMGDDDAKFNHRFLSLVHHAFGLGAAALSSWHWRDPMEGIFPCGLIHADRVPRPAASVMRAMALTFARLRPVYEQPPVLLVVPENHRLGGSRGAVTAALHRAEELLIGCHVDFGTISESRLDRLPAQVRALVYPIPYCPSDETVTALKAFVAKGGALLFTGDISYAPARKLTRASRLPELAGVERTGERYPNIARDAKATTQLNWAAGALAAPPAGDCLAQPAISVKPTGATVLATDAAGAPVVTLNKPGGGFALFCADPLETAPDVQPWHRALYVEFLRRAGIARNPVTPDEAWLQCFRTPLEGGGEAFVMWNDREQATEAMLTAHGATYRLELAGNSPGLIVLDGEGRLTAGETQGAIRRDDKLVATLRGHAILQSLDGQDLASSRQLLILPLPGHGSVPPTPDAAAEVVMPSLAGMRIELGELRSGRWTCLEPLKADSQGRLHYDVEQALNVILGAETGQFEQAKTAMAGSTD